MKAVLCTQFGGPETLQVADITSPAAGPGEVVIAVKAAGLNFFDTLIISGELGYCKPHPSVFRRLIEQLGVKKDQILFVGDDPVPDITGALQAGIQPVWMTYAQDKNIPLSPRTFSDDEIVNGNVPIISTWKDLLDLLDGK